MVTIGNAYIGTDSPGEWYDGCEAAVRKASFGQVSTTTTTTSESAATPAQQAFATDAISQVPPVGAAVSDGLLSVETLGSAGKDACDQIHSDDEYHTIPAGEPNDPTYNQAVSGFQQGISRGATSLVTVAQAQLLVYLAIKDVCPSYLNIIPAGTPGAS
jgi:hypothetical protein